MGEVPDRPENEAACLCGGCPSKVEDGMRFYCVRGASTMSVTRGFCACRWCPLWSGYGLDRDFYCDGSAVAQADEPSSLGAADDGLAGNEEAT